MYKRIFFVPFSVKWSLKSIIYLQCYTSEEICCECNYAKSLSPGNSLNYIIFRPGEVWKTFKLFI